MKIINLFILFIVLANCAAELNHGVIVEKKKEAPKYKTKHMMMFTGRVFIPIPKKYYDDEDFILYVYGVNSKGEKLEQKFFTTEEFYCKSEVGDSIQCNVNYLSRKDTDIHTYKK